MNHKVEFHTPVNLNLMTDENLSIGKIPTSKLKKGAPKVSTNGLQAAVGEGSQALVELSYLKPSNLVLYVLLTELVAGIAKESLFYLEYFSRTSKSNGSAPSSSHSIS